MDKKLYCIFIFFCSYTTMYGQEITYQLYGKITSLDTVVPIPTFIIEKDSIEIIGIAPNFVVLPDTGVYSLYSPYIEDVTQPLCIDIKSNGFYSDTIIYNAILGRKDKKGRLIWFYDGLDTEVRCNGHIIEYYSNGNKSGEGLYDDGIAIGIHKGYNRDGRVFLIVYYDNKGYEIRRFFFLSGTDNVP